MKYSIIFLFCILIPGGAFTQVSINNDNSTPDNSAMLDVKSTNKGILIPRMTQTEIETITSPANGLVVFCSTRDKFFVFLLSQNKWKEMAYGPSNIYPGGGFYCGDPLTITHLSTGGVAPVDKTVTYGTVTNIPGEISKCWITSNLGADHQATSIDDATEASAGWYWQFNHKQGYKHDGTSITPNNTWIFNIDENIEWQAINDPCTLELGSIWRIPTYTELNNLDNIGGWNNWNGPWSSALKMHGAGYIQSDDVLLYNRGSGGYYWVSTQINATLAWDLYFNSGASEMGNNIGKAYGFSLRCVRD
jgi:hypothetical protein